MTWIVVVKAWRKQMHEHLFSGPFRWQLVFLGSSVGSGDWNVCKNTGYQFQQKSSLLGQEHAEAPGGRCINWSFTSSYSIAIKYLTIYIYIAYNKMKYNVASLCHYIIFQIEIKIYSRSRRLDTTFYNMSFKYPCNVRYTFYCIIYICHIQ